MDSQKAEAFAGRLLSALNEGAFCLMASIGHRTGLFDVMRDQPPTSSDEIGVRAGLNERYVREYLARAGFRSVEKHELAHDIQKRLDSRGLERP